MDDRSSAAWPPSPEQIAGWLDGFGVGYFREVIGEQPVGEPVIESELDDGSPDGLLEALKEMAADLLRRALYATDVVLVQQLMPVTLRRVVVANADGLQVRGCQLDQTVRWLDLDHVYHKAGWHVLHAVDGTEIRVPEDRSLEPVWRTARNVVLARRRHDGALEESLARGLSRPEGDEQADRGLSSVEP